LGSYCNNILDQKLYPAALKERIEKNKRKEEKNPIAAFR
jgi:hypothetical protein